MRGSSSTRAHAPAWAGAVLEDIYPVRWAGKQAVVTLPEDIDLSNAGQIREQLLTVINRGAAVLIADMTATISCDYAGSEAMIRAYQRAVPSGTDLRLVVTDRIVRRVLSYNGLDRLVSIYPSLEAAQAVKAPAEVLGLVPRPASARADGQAPPRGSTPAGSQLPPAWPSDRNRAAVTSAELWSLVDALQDGVALADGDGALALASRRLEEMFGYEHGELLGQAVERLIPADLQAAHRSHRATYAKAPRTRPMADRLVGLRKDATTFPVEISLSPVTTVPATSPSPSSGMSPRPGDSKTSSTSPGLRSRQRRHTAAGNSWTRSSSACFSSGSACRPLSTCPRTWLGSASKKLSGIWTTRSARSATLRSLPPTRVRPAPHRRKVLGPPCCNGRGRAPRRRPASRTDARSRPGGETDAFGVVSPVEVLAAHEAQRRRTLDSGG